MNRGFAGTALPNAMMSNNQQITFNTANCGPPGGVMQLVSPPSYGVLQSPTSSSSQQPQIGMQQPFRLPFVDVDAVFQNEINSAYQIVQSDLKPLTSQYFSGAQPNVVTSSTINTSPSNVTNLTSAVMIKDAPFYAVSASVSQNANTVANTSGTSHSQLGEAKFSSVSPSANGLNGSMSASMTQNASGRYMCAICGDRATGKHYGVVSCEGCKGFFKRTVRKSLQYACREDRHCPIDKRQRNRCQFCRFEKCLQTGMKREAVQEERARANAAANQRTPNASGSANASCSPTESASASASASSAPVSGELRALLDEFLNDADDERQHAARAIVNWAKRIRPFAELPIDDRIALLRAGWNELLIATLAYRNSVAGRSRRRMNAASNSSTSGNGSFTAALNGDWSLSHESKDDEDDDDDVDTADGSGSETDTTTTLTFGDGVSVSRAAAHRAGVGVGHVFDRVVTEIVAQMRQLSIDYVELALIRAIILFNPDARGVTRVTEVERARERVYLALELHCRAQHAADDARFAKLLLRLPALRSVGLKCVEHLFFLKLFGEAPADAAVRELLTFSSSSSHDAMSSGSGSTEHGLLQSA